MHFVVVVYWMVNIHYVQLVTQRCMMLAFDKKIFILLTWLSVSLTTFPLNTKRIESLRTILRQLLLYTCIAHGYIYQVIQEKKSIYNSLLFQRLWTLIVYWSNSIEKSIIHSRSNIVEDNRANASTVVSFIYTPIKNLIKPDHFSCSFVIFSTQNSEHHGSLCPLPLIIIRHWILKQSCLFKDFNRDNVFYASNGY